MSGNLSHNMLKRLILRYNETHEEAVFHKILLRIDDLTVHSVHKFVRTHPQFQFIGLQDLYESAIVGLYEGVMTVKEKESGARLPARLIAYMKAEMLSFCLKCRESPNVLREYSSKDVIVPESTVYERLESKFLHQRYMRLIEDGIITEEEYKILNLRFVENCTLREIAKETGHSLTWVYRHIKTSLNRIRVELRRKGLEEL